MLEPLRDRLDYSSMLRPPEDGFELKYAMVCTYSLDLSALLAALLPLGFDGDAESLCRNNPVFMLHVFNKILPKIHVFCDAASIKVPDLRNNKLLVLLDRIVFPVRHKTAFHPKFWLLKFDRKGEHCYRLAILSKNLTFDRSWDVAIFFDGKVKRRLCNGAPLASVIDFLKRSQRGKSNRLHELSIIENEIKHVEFSNDEIQPEELALIPFGVNSEAAAQDIILLNPDATFYRLLVMSPFLSPETVSDLFQRGRPGAEKLLFTRKTALGDFTQEQISDIQCYCVKDEIVLGEKSELLGYPIDKPQEEDIHAKIYLFQQSKNNTPYLYLGSANLTQNGTKEKNVELLVRVKLRGHNIYETIRKDLLPRDQNGVFELCETIPSPDKAAEEIDQLKQEYRNLINIWKNLSAKVKKQKDLYSVTLHCPVKFTSKYKIEISPLIGKWKLFSSKIKFEPQLAETLSDFYKIRLSHKHISLERLLVIDTLSLWDLRNIRQEALDSSCLGKTDDILEYLSYVLSEDSYALALQKKEQNKSQPHSKNVRNSHFALYEKLLYWTAADKKRLQEIRNIIHRRQWVNSKETEALLALCETFYHAAGGE